MARDFCERQCVEATLVSEERQAECSGIWFADLPNVAEQKACGLISTVVCLNEVSEIVPHAVSPTNPRGAGGTKVRRLWEILEISNPYHTE